MSFELCIYCRCISDKGLMKYGREGSFINPKEKAAPKDRHQFLDAPFCFSHLLHLLPNSIGKSGRLGYIGIRGASLAVKRLDTIVIGGIFA